MTEGRLQRQLSKFRERVDRMHEKALQELHDLGCHDQCAPGCAGVAQSDERLLPKQQAAGSTPVTRSSRDQAIQAAVRKFDGFEVREEWDIAERMIAVIEGSGYEELIELILDAAAENGHMSYRDGG